MRSISWIWIIFTFIFLGLSIFHFIQSGNKVAQFQISKRPLDDMGRAKILGADIDKPLKDFAKDFNSFVDNYNKSTSIQNLIACIGYLIASFVSIFSMVLVLKSKTKNIKTGM